MDYQAASDQIGNMLGEDLVGKREPAPTLTAQQSEPVPAPTQEAQPTQEPIKTYDVPKSWKREMHEHWGKVTPEAQAYIIEREKQLLDGFQSFRPIQDALTPHQEFLSRANIAPAQAVASLLHAQRRLVEGTDEQRWQAFQELAKHLGHDKRLAQPQAQTAAAQPMDPAMQTLQQRVEAMEAQAKAQWEAQVNEIRTANMKAVDAFAADTKAHPYFDEVGTEMSILISQGYSLQEAYDTAVRMNPAVYAKEQARVLTEHEAKLKENARLAALPKKKAASVNIKSNGDGPEPTEPVGTLEDTIRSVYRAKLTRA
jgi:hypothetical protein